MENRINESVKLNKCLFGSDYITHKFCPPEKNLIKFECSILCVRFVFRPVVYISGVILMCNFEKSGKENYVR